jgi:hypothetical protein
MPERTTKSTSPGKEKTPHICAVGGCETSGNHKLVCCKHWCASDGCKQLVLASSSNHCVDHTCEDHDCSSEAQHRSSYCAVHIRCKVSDCQRFRTDSPGPFCKSHTKCMHNDCSQGVDLKGFCNKHQCQAPDCRQGHGHRPWGDDLLPSDFCPLHMCQWESSRRYDRNCSKANEGLSYCPDHRCTQTNCQRRVEQGDQSNSLAPHESFCRTHLKRISNSDSGYDDEHSYDNGSTRRSHDGRVVASEQAGDVLTQERRNEGPAEKIGEEVPQWRQQRWNGNRQAEEMPGELPQHQRPRQNRYPHAQEIPTETPALQRSTQTGYQHPEETPQEIPQPRRQRQTQLEHAEEPPEELPKQTRNDQWRANNGPGQQYDELYYTDDVPQRNQHHGQKGGSVPQPQHRAYTGKPADRRPEEGRRQDRPRTMRGYHEDVHQRERGY